MCQSKCWTKSEPMDLTLCPKNVDLTPSPLCTGFLLSDEKILMEMLACLMTGCLSQIHQRGNSHFDFWDGHWQGNLIIWDFWDAHDSVRFNGIGPQSQNFWLMRNLKQSVFKNSLTHALLVKYKSILCTKSIILYPPFSVSVVVVSCLFPIFCIRTWVISHHFFVVLITQTFLSHK